MSEEVLTPGTGVLSGFRIIDWTEQEGAYAGRLLADLGADVVRVETAAAMAVWPEEPIGPAGAPLASGFERFVNLNKRSIWVDVTCSDGLRLLLQMLHAADAVITSGETEKLSDELGLRGELAGLDVLHVCVSAFGMTSPGAGMVADDLVTLASGGLLSLGGYPDAEPVAVYGNQTYIAGGISAAVAVLLGLIARRSDTAVDMIDVSTQAVIAAALEDAPAEYDLTGSVRLASGDEPREAGTGTFRCRDGWVAIVAGKLGTARAWDALVAWMVDERVAGADLFAGAEWKTLEHRRLPSSVAAFRQSFESFLSGWSRQDFYAEAQRRGISVAPVNSIPDLLEDVQLMDRQFFRKVPDPLLGMDVIYPGAPFRLPDHGSVSWRPAPLPGWHTRHVLEEWLGMDQARVGDLRRAGAIR
jgi:crotonobetainyl-CoA:carnitine CoA-transferase CaiB-like acyl-CoA transferase